jgi:hypothetical protein
MISLFYLSPNPYGGWVTYTHHLIRALEAVDDNVKLYKVGKRTENFTRNFGYGDEYQNISLEDALALPGHKLIVAAAKNYRAVTDALWEQGAALVMHDPTEIKNLPCLEPERTIVIRRAGLDYIPEAHFIRHPYERRGPVESDRTLWAVSVSRIDFDKHTDILLDANRLLPDDRKIEIRGFENRIYTRFKIVPKYPEWVQSRAHFDRVDGAAFDLLKCARFCADMSIIKGDGGGTQYTFLEAWDAGAIPIIHKDWVREGDDMVPGKNCLAVGNAMELAEIIMGNYDRTVGVGDLSLHDPVAIGHQYATALGLLEDL